MGLLGVYLFVHIEQACNCRWNGIHVSFFFQSLFFREKDFTVIYNISEFYWKMPVISLFEMEK